jgi:hypothetical protein
MRSGFVNFMSNLYTQHISGVVSYKIVQSIDGRYSAHREERKGFTMSAKFLGTYQTFGEASAACDNDLATLPP